MKPSDDQINAALETIRKAGGTVTFPQADEWITPTDLWRSIGGIDQKSRFYDRLHHPRCPQYQRKVGATGRITTLRPTPALLDWAPRC